ncbi:dTDP-4-dehydrorhamnose 3,5-epimerase family protein [Kordiimonas sp. SCSIO 12603]|uniref:dTDP-4-dehydrorhamnose 3,5-epimerase family protein n=1 Tax=Kordiimonas sp. SCSIO 12603 TaxID=2829596 RepID=UPI0021046256|nr:dTDP-4-dehydrorhamnose 3,5-epimerase family protein [Kordiimonas sp. SCSIO 12603]UTW56984.1 dTDP-4-dehydrorhamnose 3,5-epimerase family protein [Kordiimonas sp. SCSIO 12603]
MFDVFSLPEGVIVSTQQKFSDDRGWLYEGYNISRCPTELRQLTISESDANTLRGMHVHYKRHDYVMVVSGALILGLVDMRPNSDSFRKSSCLILKPEEACTVYIPLGIGHGFAFQEKTRYLTGLSVAWSPEDEFLFRYDDPVLQFDWGVNEPILSEKDRNAGSFESAVRQYLEAASGSQGG